MEVWAFSCFLIHRKFLRKCAKNVRSTYFIGIASEIKDCAACFAIISVEWPKQNKRYDMEAKMYEWQKQIQIIVNEIDECIKQGNDEALTLQALAGKLGYSEFHFTRKFREISGVQFRDYLRCRKLAFTLKEVRDTEKGILEIAVKYGFSSHEAFSRAFKKLYGVTPGEYRKNPMPVVLRTRLCVFDRYFLGIGGSGMIESTGAVKTYFVTIPAHKFLHIENRESNGYWDFWQKQSVIPGQDCETICGLLDSIKGKLDDKGGNVQNAGSGQIMAYMNDPEGRLCSWGILRTECYGVRLPADYRGEVPSQMILTDVPEGEYIVFEHGPYDYETENCHVEEMIEEAMKQFNYEDTGYCLDTTPGRMMYFYHDPAQFWKYIRPVRKA